MDLDVITEKLKQFENSYYQIWDEEANLKQQLGEHVSRERRYEHSLLAAQDNNKQLLSTITDLQSTVQQRRDYRDQNNLLVEENHALKERAGKEKTVLTEKLAELQEALATAEEHHKQTVEKLAQTSSDKLMKVEQDLQSRLNELDQMLVDEKQKTLHLQEEKTHEIGRITMQYESKLSQLRSQQMKLQSKAQPNAFGNEIFRKKLQHLQEESSKKENFYQTRIRELEMQLKENAAPLPKMRSMHTPQRQHPVPDYSSHLNHYLSKNKNTSSLKRKRM